EDFNTIIAEPRLGTVSTGSATKDLVLKFKEMDQVLKKMDIMIKPFSRANKDFVDSYFGARAIVDLGHRKSGTKYAVFEVLIRDFETQAPIEGASFFVVETGQKIITGADGKARVSLKVAGTFTIQVTMEGYTPYTEEGINILLGNQLNFEIDLEAEA
ncbi:MAG: carboxypeptidase regulatory-like domain-containing protein, partial [Bacteroidetes bacterium]|nr:carboxypeptidase regulatory-like domain-containing protein [Bacteroidota bacterium]